MKLAFQILLAFLLFLGSLVAIILYATSGVTKVADAFFQQIAADNPEKAQKFLAEQFKSGTSLAELDEYFTELSLTNYQSANWTSRNVTIGTASLEGTIITNSGGRVPLQLNFVKENGEWKILGIQTAQAGLASKKVKLNIPTVEEAAMLVQDTTDALGQSVRQRNWSDFYSATSKNFQQQVSIAKLETAFETLIETGLNFEDLEKLEPLFTSTPAVSAQGVLVLEGYYASNPAQTYFIY